MHLYHYAMKSARLNAFAHRLDDIRVEDVPVPGPGLPAWISRQSQLKLLGNLRAVKKLEQVTTAAGAALAPARTAKVMLQIGSR